jgi:hypothetical protein
VAFQSQARNLDPNDTDGRWDIYLKDLATGHLLLVSTSNVGAKGNAQSSVPSVSAKAGRVAFESQATNFDGRDLDGFSDIYVKQA